MKTGIKNECKHIEYEFYRKEIHIHRSSMLLNQMANSQSSPIHSIRISAERYNLTILYFTLRMPQPLGFPPLSLVAHSLTPLLFPPLLPDL